MPPLPTSFVPTEDDTDDQLAADAVDAVPVDEDEDELPAPVVVAPRYGPFVPSASQRQLALDLLLVDSVTLEIAARAIGLGVKRFARTFPREIAEAKRIRSALGTGGTTSVSRTLRYRVQCQMLAGLSSEEAARTIIPGGMDVDRFREVFAAEIDNGAEDLRVSIVRRQTHIAMHGSDRDSISAAKFILERKGGFDRPVRRGSDAATGKGAGGKSKAELEREIVATLSAQLGIDAGDAKAALTVLARVGRGTPGAKPN